MPVIQEFETELVQRSPKAFGQWVGIDLHNHSPVSKDYQGDRSNAIELTSNRLRETDVGVVMFTDHEKLTDAAFASEVAKRSKRTVLRGVELNIFVDAWGKPEGKVDKNLFFHLLVGFDPDGKQSPDYWLDDAYRRFSRTERMCGNERVIGLQCPIDDLCKYFREEAGAITIPAHLHSTADAFRSRSADDIFADPQFLRHAKSCFTALEVTNRKTAKYFDGANEATGRIHKTCSQSSDAHDPNRLGTRISYALMEHPTFAELRAALELPHRVSLDAPRIPSSHVVGVQIRGQFLPDFWLSFSPHANAFIGVKGSGKTSLLECLRYALGSPVPASRQEAVSGHLSAILGANGLVRVLVKREDGAKVLVERSINNPQFKLTFDNDRVESFSNSEALLFPTYILGWHEIEQAATDPKIRRIYLDTIAGRETVRSLEEEADATVKRIQHAHDAASSKYGVFRTLHEKIDRLDEYRRGLQELTDSNLLELKQRYENAIRHKAALDSLKVGLREAIAAAGDRVSALIAIPSAETFQSESPISSFVKVAAGLTATLTTQLGDLGKLHATNLRTILKQLDETAPDADKAYSDFLIEYEARVRELPQDKRKLLETHQKVLEETRELPSLKVAQDGLQLELEKMLQDLGSLCTVVANLLDKRTEVRETKVSELNKQLASYGVQLAVEPLARREALTDLSQRFASGAKVYNEVASFAGSESRSHRKLARAYEALRDDLVGGYRLFFETAEFATFLGYYENDDLKIRFKVGKANEEFSPIDQLSAGQRCTAVFPLLLKLQEGPLVVDQPEDNLDNRYIADVIAPALLNDKQSRQISFTSHNANLVVLTDAEQIAMFESDGSVGRIEARGFLSQSGSKVAPHVISILDGGDRALMFRYKKYGIGPQFG